MILKVQSKFLLRPLLLLLVPLVVLGGILAVIGISSDLAQRRSRKRGAVVSPVAAQLASCPAPAPLPASQRHWRRVWTAPAGSWLEDAPTPWSNGWIVATGKGRLLALDNSGRMLWNHAFSNLYFAGSPTVAGGSVVAATSGGDVLAVEAATGKLQWRVPLAASFRHGPLAIRCDNAWQVVLLGSKDGVLHCLDGKDGRELWTSPPTGQSDGPPGCDGKFLAFGNCTAILYVLSVTNGESVAQVRVGPGVESGSGSTMPAGVMAGGVLVRDGRAFGGTGGGDLVCVDVASNTVVWQDNIASREAFSTPVAASNLVIMGSRDGDVAAWVARDGTPRWRVTLSNGVDTLCAVDDAVFAVVNGSLLGLRVRDGSTFLQIAVGDRVEGPSWNGQTLVVSDDGGNLIGFRGE